MHARNVPQKRSQHSTAGQGGGRGVFPADGGVMHLRDTQVSAPLAHQRAFAKQALDQVYRQFGGLVAHIQRGVQLDHVE
jgi:hypothetical protein